MSRVQCRNPISSLEKRFQMPDSGQVGMSAKSVDHDRLARRVRQCFHELSCVPVAKTFLPGLLMQSRPGFLSMSSDTLEPTDWPDLLHRGPGFSQPAESEDFDVDTCGE